MSRRAPATLRVASYNLLHGISLHTGQADLAAAAEAIAGLEADVVGVQEVDRNLPRTNDADQISDLAAATGLHGTFAPALLGDPDTAWTGATDVDPGGPAYGVGLLTRVPLAEVRRVILPGGGDGHRPPGVSLRNPGWDREPRVLLTGWISVDGTPVQVSTTHLSYLPWRGLAQLRAALAVAGSPAHPALLVGDLNLPAWLVRLALDSGWSHGGGEPTYPSWRPRVQVDHLLVRGGIQVRQVGVNPSTTSDHLALVATLALPVAGTAAAHGGERQGRRGGTPGRA